MDFGKVVSGLAAKGYKRAAARAQDKKMLERDSTSIVARLAGVFGDAVFKRQLRKKKFAWLDVSPSVATKAILDFIPTVR